MWRNVDAKAAMVLPEHHTVVPATREELAKLKERRTRDSEPNTGDTMGVVVSMLEVRGVRAGLAQVLPVALFRPGIEKREHAITFRIVKRNVPASTDERKDQNHVEKR